MKLVDFGLVLLLTKQPDYLFKRQPGWYLYKYKKN